MTVTTAGPGDVTDWLALRRALWPDATPAEHEGDIGGILADAEGLVAFMARGDDGAAIGFAEVSLRRDYVNGCDTSPVAFLEGIYVGEAFRGRGVARMMVAAAEHWGRERGCSEFASDAAPDNAASLAMHAALGFAETQRVVFFRKVLDGNER